MTTQRKSWKIQFLIKIVKNTGARNIKKSFFLEKRNICVTVCVLKNDTFRTFYFQNITKKLKF